MASTFVCVSDCKRYLLTYSDLLYAKTVFCTRHGGQSAVPDSKEICLGNLPDAFLWAVTGCNMMIHCFPWRVGTLRTGGVSVIEHTHTIQPEVSMK